MTLQRSDFTVWKKRVLWGLDTLQLSTFTFNTNNNPSLFNTLVSKSPAVGQSSHQHWPCNTNQLWQKGVRKLAGKITFLFVSKQVYSELSEEEGLHHNPSRLHSDSNPMRGGWFHIDRGQWAASVDNMKVNQMINTANTDLFSPLAIVKTPTSW